MEGPANQRRSNQLLSEKPCWLGTAVEKEQKAPLGEAFKAEKGLLAKSGSRGSGTKQENPATVSPHSKLAPREPQGTKKDQNSRH